MQNDKGHETELRSSQGNHTPGPWRIWKGEAGEMKYLVGADDQGFAHTVGLGEPRDTANARLIAAAPELLGALFEMESAFKNDESESQLDFERQALSRARAALSKVAARNG